MSLRGKTLFITGASRGIGLAIALRAARDGANIAVAAKTAEPHPKLPGTIHSAAAEIEAAGGRALPLIVDVRDEASVAAAVQRCAQVFGGIDICVNNASAINLAATEQIEHAPLRPDQPDQHPRHLRHLARLPAVPEAGRQPAHPDAVAAARLPPQVVRGRTWRTRCPSTACRCACSGLAEEYRAAGIACNALWPRTTIATAAVEFALGGAQMLRRSRKPEIVADAAHVILSRPARECTGQFFIDDSVLYESGRARLRGLQRRPGREAARATCSSTPPCRHRRASRSSSCADGRERQPPHRAGPPAAGRAHGRGLPPREHAGAGGRPRAAAAAHPLPVARPVHARAHERCALVRAAGGARRGDGRADRERVVEPRTSRASRSGDLVRRQQRLAGLRPVRRRATSCKIDPAPPAARPTRWACSACRASPPTSGCSTSASRKPGETVVVAAATGAVGSVVGPDRQDQGLPRGRHRRRRGEVRLRASRRSASTPASITARRSCRERLAAACPKGIDVYFENVGGAVLERRRAAAQHRTRACRCAG